MTIKTIPRFAKQQYNHDHTLEFSDDVKKTWKNIIEQYQEVKANLKPPANRKPLHQSYVIECG